PASVCALTCVVAFLFLAVVLRLAYGGPGVAAWGNTVALLVLTAALCLVVQGYFPLVLSYFIIPAARIGSRKRYWLVFVGLAVVAASIVAAWQLAQRPPAVAAKAGVDPAPQRRHVVQNPPQFPAVLRASIGKPPIVHVLSQAYSGFLVTNLLNPSIPLLAACAGLFLFVCILDVVPGLGRVGFRRRLVPIAVAAISLPVVLLFAYLYR